MKQYVLYSLFLISCIFSGCFEDKNIITIKSFSEVNFDAFNSEDLVLFDVDDTLIQHKDMLWSADSAHFKDFTNKAKERGDFDNHALLEEIQEVIFKETKKILIEKDIISQINILQQKGIPICAITAMTTGKWHSIERLEQWRYDQLKEFGFIGTWSDEEYLFNGLMGKPVFYKGILATDEETKGPLVGAFLDWKQLKPKKIIMFDDRLAYLESVQKECKIRNITFQGYLYQGKKTKEWNEHLAWFQHNHLMKHKKWLSDEMAMKLMNQEKNIQKTVDHQE